MAYPIATVMIFNRFQWLAPSMYVKSGYVTSVIRFKRSPIGNYFSSLRLTLMLFGPFLLLCYGAREQGWVMRVVWRINFLPNLSLTSSQMNHHPVYE